jgi:hypothetical protein
VKETIKFADQLATVAARHRGSADAQRDDLGDHQPEHWSRSAVPTPCVRCYEP